MPLTRIERTLITILAVGVVTGIALLQLRKPPSLPRFSLLDGAEFRVMKETLSGPRVKHPVIGG